jgi:hypothetical protein
VSVGAFSGAFGTVAWLSVLRLPTIPVLLLGVLFLGAAPLAVGVAMLWAGLSVVDTQMARSRVRAVPIPSIVAAVHGGATPQVVALRLGLSDVPEIEARLDELVAHDALALTLTDEGELYYRPLA